MSDYNSSALIAFREKLKTNIAMKPHLFDMLEEKAGGFMTRAEAKSVRNAEDPMGWLLEILLGKGDKEFNTFCDMLDKSNHRGWAASLRQEAKPIRQKEDCKAVVTVDPAYDVETLEEGDYKYLRKAIQNARKNKKINPHRVMKTLYCHTYHRVVNITANYGAQRFRDIMVVARTAITMGLVKGDIRALDTADTVADVLDVLHDDEDWKHTGLLEEIVNYLPEDARAVAVSLLDRYNSYLNVFEEELPVQELPTSDVAVPERTRARVEITVDKKITEYTFKDCKEMLHMLLHICWHCPHDEDMVDVQTGSTTVDTSDVAVPEDEGKMSEEVTGNGMPYDMEKDTKARKTAQFEKSLKAALDKGFVEVELVKCVTLGPPEAGKTQLKRALIGKFDCSSESTPMSTGAEAVMQRYISEESVWEPLTREKLRKSLHTTVNMMEQKESDSPNQSNVDEKDSFSPKSEVPEEQGVGQKVQPGSTGMREGPTSTSIPKADSKKALLQKQFAALKASVEEGLKETEPAGVKGLDKIRIVHLIDSGGQPAFYDIHPVIATSRAVYLLVYNMKEGLDHKPAITYRKDFPTKQLPNTKQSNLDMIKNSLGTIHDCSQKFITLENELHGWFGSQVSTTASAGSLPVLVVGTRKRDKESITGESDKLKKECSYLPLWHKVLHCTDTGTKLFAVESTDPKCQGVQSVRKVIDRAGCTYKLRLPISWVFCQLIFWSAEENLHVVTFANLQGLCQKEGLIANPNEFLAMVRTFHLLGIISFPYFDQELCLGKQWEPHDEPVFTNPDVLYQQATKILEVVYRDLDNTPMKPDAMYCLSRLQNSGQLDTDTLGFLGIPDEFGSYDGFHAYLLERMIHWGLAAKRTSEVAAGTGRTTYFIPSCLPACEEEPDLFTETLLAFTFFLKLEDKEKFHYYVPRGIFPHMIVQAEGMGFAVQENTDYDKCLFRDAAVLGTGPSHSDKMQYAYNVTVVDKMDHVTVSIDPADVSKKKSSPADCRQIVSDLKHAMEATYKRIYYKSLDVTVVSKCRCVRRGTPASHLAKIVCCQDSQYSMECLLPGRIVCIDCPPEIAALLCDQVPAVVQPLSPPQAEISHTAEVLIALDHQLDAQWRLFGTYLYVKSSVMDGISKDNSDVDTCIMRLLDKWLGHENGTGDCPRTWQTVVQAVKHTGKGLLAEQLAEQHGVQLPGQ